MGIMRTLTINGETYSVTPVVPTTSVTLLANAWVYDGDYYSQIVEVPGVTAHTKVDLQPTPEQLVEFHNKVLGFTTKNVNGVVTVSAVGDKPSDDHVIQTTLTEVEGTGPIIGNTVGTTMPRPDWSQADPTKADYVKNRPMYDGVYTVPVEAISEDSVSFDPDGDLLPFHKVSDLNVEVTAETTLSVYSWNGEQYMFENVLLENVSDGVWQYLTVILCTRGGLTYKGATIPEAGVYVISSMSIMGPFTVYLRNVKKLDEKYLPNTVPVIQSATVGQIIRVKAVDEHNVPTEWETVEPPGRTLLWENVNPFNEFAPQDVNVQIVGNDAVEILFYIADEEGLASPVYIPTDAPSQNHVASAFYSAMDATVSRYFYINKDSISFEGCNATDLASGDSNVINEYMVPYRIYGVKL